jgi:hypothetical protein
MPSRDEDFRFHMGWLLWLALASVACLPTAGWSPFSALGVGAVLVGAWILVNVSPKRLISSGIMAILEVFFREMGAREH